MVKWTYNTKSQWHTVFINILSAFVEFIRFLSVSGDEQNRRNEINTSLLEWCGWRPLSKMHRKYLRISEWASYNWRFIAHFLRCELSTFVVLLLLSRSFFRFHCAIATIIIGPCIVVVSVTHILFVFIFHGISDKSRQSKLTAHSLILLNQSICYIWANVREMCSVQLMLFILTLILCEFDLMSVLLLFFYTFSSHSHSYLLCCSDAICSH